MTVISFPKGERVSETLDLICFSHLRWDFVYQRPQHLMSRFARDGRVFIIEEPVPAEGAPKLDVQDRGPDLWVCVPHIPAEIGGAELPAVMQHLLEVLRLEKHIDNYITWFYTPMMLPWSKLLSPRAVVYDCMDELSGFRGAPPELCELERELFAKADLVFTGGQSLYEAKRSQHHSVHAFPSSIDAEHFGKAIKLRGSVNDQEAISRPRVGFIGVIDERLDIDLLRSIAELRPDWSFVMVGPVVKIDPQDLPRPANIHYLGQRSYDELPAILSEWDIAMLPFALNESTRFISPTKTPEYLAAGLPVVSTPITDVVRPYGERDLVEIAATPDEFVEAVERLLAGEDTGRRARIDEFIGQLSWDKTYAAMSDLIAGVLDGDRSHSTAEAGR